MNPELNNNIISKDKLKEVLITRTAMKTLKPISTIEAIISHSFKEAAAALKTNRDVEVSGFGIFKTNDFRARQLIEKKQRQINFYEGKIKSGTLSESGIANYQRSIEKLKIDITSINLKLNKQETDED